MPMTEKRAVQLQANDGPMPVPERVGGYVVFEEAQDDTGPRRIYPYEGWAYRLLSHAIGARASFEFAVTGHLPYRIYRRIPGGWDEVV